MLGGIQDKQIAYGTQERIVQPVTSVRAVVTEDFGQPEVQLIAAIGALVGQRLPPVPTATTVAIHMAPEVAKGLYAELRGLFAKMGWPLPK